MPAKLGKKKLDVGNCLKCGRRITFCGKPFTADIACRQCFHVNHYRNSQQPIPEVKRAS